MADQAIIKKLEKAAQDIKIKLLELTNKTEIHIGGDLSIADMMTAVWAYAMKFDPKNPKWAERDRFLLSKGHAAAVTSFCQASIGCYDPDEIIREYGTDCGRFGMHSCNLENPSVDVSTGSLGHGLPVAAGIATALKAQKSKSRVFVGMGDGELGEGSIWEGAMLAAHYKLGNLIAFVDRNGISLDGRTEELMALEPVSDKWCAFGWRVVEIDGHNMGQIVDTIDSLPAPDSDKPTVIIGKTVKGHGVSFMENRIEWHCKLLDVKDLELAKSEIRDAFNKKWGEQ